MSLRTVFFEPQSHEHSYSIVLVSNMYELEPRTPPGRFFFIMEGPAVPFMTYSDAGRRVSVWRWTLASTSGTVPSLTATSEGCP